MSAAVPLTGADCFLRAFDAEIRRVHGASHASQLVLRLGPGFDPALFQKQLEEVVHAQPLLRAPIRRPLGMGAPVYRVDQSEGCAMPRVTVHPAEGTPGDALPEVFAQRLNERFDHRNGELLRFDVVQYEGGAAGTDIAATWLHMLFDGSGSERFMVWLDACFRGAARPGELPAPDELAPHPRALTAKEAGDRATRWQKWVQGFGETPPRSLSGPLRRTPQRLRYDVHALDAAESERATARAKEKAGFLTPMLFYLAAAIRAHHAVYTLRGIDPGSYLVPLPVNLRPKGMEGAIFRTHVSLLWFQVQPDVVGDFDALVGALKQQRVAMIKAGHVENGTYAMDFARYAPARVYAHMARRHLAGELCSFFFAWTGEFCEGMQRFFGAEVRTGYHIAPVPPSPGSCVAASMKDGLITATHTRQQGVFTPEELEAFAAQLRSDLTG